MLLRTLFLFLWIFISLPVFSQQMFVEEFTKVKTKGVKSKQFAIVDLYTNEKGFVFSLGKQPIESQEEEGFIRLRVPHKSTFINIEHADYGKLAWKVPNTELKKKKRYKAYLRTESIDKEFKLSKQWAVFHICPTHAILYIDTLMHTTETGVLAFYLPVGKHACKIVSPFYSELTDTIEIVDSVRFERSYDLKTYFSFLRVETDNAEARILLNHKEIGRGSAYTDRLQPGKYQLSVYVHNQLCYTKDLQIANAETKVVRISSDELVPHIAHVSQVQRAKTQQQQEGMPSSTEQSRAHEVLTALLPEQPSRVTIQAFDDDCEILINREKIGQGSWQGELVPGFYSLSSHKKGFDSQTFYFWVEPGKDLELNLKSPLADYGMLNISCNYINAMAFINGVLVGKTPCVIQNLPAHQHYHLILMKGDKKAEKQIQLRANDILNVNLFLK